MLCFQTDGPDATGTGPDETGTGEWEPDTWGMQLLNSGSSPSACKARKKGFDEACGVDSSWMYVGAQTGLWSKIKGGAAKLGGKIKGLLR